MKKARKSERQKARRKVKKEKGRREIEEKKDVTQERDSYAVLPVMNRWAGAETRLNKAGYRAP